MTDFKKWAGNDINTTADIQKGENYRKDITNLAKVHDWQLENQPDLFELNPILVKTIWDAQDNRPRDEINNFRKELECILQKYGVEIKEFYSEGRSNDSRPRRRIEIQLRGRI